jgi:hypothetical protein
LFVVPCLQAGHAATPSYIIDNKKLEEKPVRMGPDGMGIA